MHGQAGRGRRRPAQAGSRPEPRCGPGPSTWPGRRRRWCSRRLRWPATRRPDRARRWPGRGRGEASWPARSDRSAAARCGVDRRAWPPPRPGRRHGGPRRRGQAEGRRRRLRGAVPQAAQRRARVVGRRPRRSAWRLAAGGGRPRAWARGPSRGIRYAPARRRPLLGALGPAGPLGPACDQLRCSPAAVHRCADSWRPGRRRQPGGEALGDIGRAGGQDAGIHRRAEHRGPDEQIACASGQAADQLVEQVRTRGFSHCLGVRLEQFSGFGPVGLLSGRGADGRGQPDSQVVERDPADTRASRYSRVRGWPAVSRQARSRCASVSCRSAASDSASSLAPDRVSGPSRWNTNAPGLLPGSEKALSLVISSLPVQAASRAARAGSRTDRSPGGPVRLSPKSSSRQGRPRPGSATRLAGEIYRAAW